MGEGKIESMALWETPDQEKTWILQRIQELVKERVHEMWVDEMRSGERMDEISAQIHRLEARLKELGGVLYQSYAPEPEDSDLPS